MDTPGHFCPFCGTPAPTPKPEPEDPFVGRKVAGKYFVHQRLGKGGMGLVYKATDVILDRPVALKMLDRTLLSDSGMVQRFHREARAASRLHHSNCIVILDFGQLEDGQLYIAMEFLPGRALTRLLTEEFPLDHGRVVRIVAQILAALAEAHGAGIIHRDLKLSNVMVETRRDEPDFVKVLDFGIAKLMVGGGSELTTAGMICGTPGYMSPEQARGEELDARSDLYSVGIILYELLTGRLPFESETPMGLAVKHMTDTPEPPSTRRPDLHISPELDAIIMRALAKDREERFSSAEEMRAALLQTTVAVPAPRTTPRPGPTNSTMVIPSAGGPPTPARPRVDVQRPSTRPPTKGGPTPRPAADEIDDGADGETATPTVATPAPQTPSRREPRRPAPKPGLSRATRTYIIAGVAAGVAVIALLAVTLLADPFKTKPPAAIDPGLTLVKPNPPPPKTEPPPPPPKVEQQPPPKVDPPPPPKAELPPPKVEQPVPKVDPPPPPPTDPQPPPRPSKPPKAEQPRPEPQPKVGVVQVGPIGSIAVPSASSELGILEINANPWGEIAIDGHPIGETPFEVKIGAGRHRIRATHATLGTRDRAVTVKAGQRNRYHVDFDAR